MGYACIHKHKGDKMKLLDVLAKEMKEWPEGGYSVGQATDGTLHVNNKRGILLYHTTKAYSQPSAGEYYTDEITRDMWENSRVKSKTIDSTDKVTFRVALVMDVECSSEAEAHKIWKEWVKTNKPNIRDVSNLVCCKEAESSNGWHHSSGCKNWVLCY